MKIFNLPENYQMCTLKSKGKFNKDKILQETNGFV